MPNHPTILIIDDCLEDRETYKHFLRQAESQVYRIIEFENGEDALAWCEQNWADAILLDYYLPTLDGLDIIRHLRRQQPDTIWPIILLTGHSSTSLAVQALKLGAQDYLSKDQITQETLSQALRHVMQQVQVQQQLFRQNAQQQVLFDLVLRMRQSLKPQDVLDATTQDVCQFLQGDRTVIYQFASDWSGEIVSEFVKPGWPVTLTQQIQDTCFQERAGALLYQQGHAWAMADIEQANLTDCHRQLLERYGIKANLVVPILQYIPAQADENLNPSLWGLLIVHHCAAPHEWQEEEIVFVTQVAAHLSIAIQQANLHQQAQTELAERKRAEAEREQTSQQLQENLEKLQLFVKYAPAGLAMFDCEMHYIIVSQQWLDMFDYPSKRIEDYIGRSHYACYPDIPERWRKAHQRSLAGEIEVCEEDSITTSDGIVHWFRWETRPWYTANSEIGGIVISSEEITERKNALMALEERTSRLKLAQSASKSGVWDWDLITNELFWSPEYYALYGLDPTTPSSYENWLHCIHPEDREQVSQKTLKAIHNGEPDIAVDFRVITSEPMRWFSARGRVIRNEAGEPVRYIGIAMDVTEQKQAEMALQESEDRFRRAILDAPIPIMLIVEDGEILLLNQSWTDITGYTHADIPTIEAWTEKAFGARKDEIRALIRKRFTQPSPTYAGEYSLTTKAGHKRVWDFYSAPLGCLADGRRFRITMAVDLTERRQLEAQLQGIIDESEVLIYLKDRKGKYFLINHQLEMVTQLNSADILGKTDFELFPSEVANALWTNDQYVLETGKRLQFEESVPLPEGSRTYLSLKFPLQDIGGKTYAVCGMSTDITELKQAQTALRQSNEQLQSVNLDLERANHVKDSFMRMMSHELRTPLNPILGMAEALQEEIFGSLNERQHGATAMIVDNGQRLLKLINNLLNMVELESNRVELDIDVVSVQNLCKASLNAIQPEAEAKDIQLQLQIAPGITIIQADGDRLKHVLTNLLENAVKFTPKGGSVGLEVRMGADSPSSIQFSIKDTGIGISLEKQEHLFQFFSQLDDRLNRNFEGTGVGLFLAQRLVQLHDGQITVISQEGQGSCFTVTLPL